MKLKYTILVISLICLISPAQALGYIDSANVDFGSIDNYVLREMELWKIPGLAIGIVHGNDIVYLKGYGKANSKGELVTPQTPFVIGSVSKSFTALAIKQLEQKGRINIDDPVIKYIPWFRVADFKASQMIKIKDLINHTSGISTSSGTEAYLYNSKYTLEDIVRKSDKIKLNSPIGENFEYSNLNYLILGLIIEKVTGLTYESYIQKHIFNAIEMKNSFTSEINAVNNGMAEGHRTIYGVSMPTHFPYPRGNVSAGFIISSVEDMSKYVTCYLNNGYYNNKSIIPNNQLSFLEETIYSFNPADLYYGSYWELKSGYPQGYNRFDGYAGATPNYTSAILISQETKYGVVVVSNMRDAYWSNEVTALSIGNGITDILLGKGIPPNYPRYINWKYYILPVIVLIGVSIRLLWIRRYRRNIGSTKIKFTVSIISLITDIVVPLLLLWGVPTYYDSNWDFFFGANPEYALIFFISAIALILLAAVKFILLLSVVSKRTNR